MAEFNMFSIGYGSTYYERFFLQFQIVKAFSSIIKQTLTVIKTDLAKLFYSELLQLQQ